MADRRNLIGAFGVAVFIAGLGTLLSYMVALGAQKEPMHWHSSVAVASFIVMGAGALLGAVVLWLFHVVKKHRLKIDEFVERGCTILVRLQTLAATAQDERDADDWAAQVRVWLHKNIRHWESHFRNIASARTFDEILATWTAAKVSRSRDARIEASAEILRVQLDRLSEMTMRL